jgi:2,3-bisphosphoglycerate-independent phosphoglycerate mutase
MTTKYVIVHGEGMAGAPHQDLGGRSVLQAAATPSLDFLARNGELGLATIHTEGLAPGSDSIYLTVLGYDPRKYHSGPAPFEAASLGVALGEHDVAFRCSMVTLRSNHAPQEGPWRDEVKKLGPQVVMDDATAGVVAEEEARELIDAVNEQLGSETIQFYPGRGHQHLMVWVGGNVRTTCADPHAAVGRPIGSFLPNGDGAEILRKVMDASLVILRDHPINEQRREAGLKPANCLWLWGQGRPARLPKLTEQHQLSGTVVSTSDLLRGIGICAGLEAVDVPVSGEAGEANFLGLAETALRELAKKDLVYVHVELPREARHASDPKAKLKAVEEFDRKTVRTILEGLPKLGPHRILLLCDHPTVGGGQARTIPPIPYALYAGPVTQEAPAGKGFSEGDAEGAQDKVRDGTRLMPRLLAS